MAKNSTTAHNANLIGYTALAALFSPLALRVRLVPQISSDVRYAAGPISAPVPADVGGGCPVASRRGGTQEISTLHTPRRDSLGNGSMSRRRNCNLFHIRKFTLVIFAAALTAWFGVVSSEVSAATPEATVLSYEHQEAVGMKFGSEAEAINDWIIRAGFVGGTKKWPPSTKVIHNNNGEVVGDDYDITTCLRALASPYVWINNETNITFTSNCTISHYTNTQPSTFEGFENLEPVVYDSSYNCFTTDGLTTVCNNRFTQSPMELTRTPSCRDPRTHYLNSTETQCLPNKAPMASISSPSEGATFGFGRPINFSGTSSDIDNFPDPLTDSWQLPGGSPGSSAASSGTVSYTDVGDKTLTYTATDGNLTTTTSVTIKIINDPPKTAGTLQSPVVIRANQSVVLPVDISDKDVPFGDVLTITSSGAVNFSSIVAGASDDAKRIRLSPNNTQVGIYNGVVFTVSDKSGASVNIGPVDIIVDIDNAYPTIGNLLPKNEVLVGETYDYDPAIADAENDPLTIEVQNAPRWADPAALATGRIASIGDLTAADEGIYSGIVVRVKDTPRNGTRIAPPDKQWITVGPFQIIVRYVAGAKNMGSNGDCENPTNPINLATGNKHQSETDYVGEGVMPLEFSRHYNSMLQSTFSADGLTVHGTSLGVNWLHTFDRKLDTSLVAQDQVRAFRDDGNVYLFKRKRDSQGNPLSDGQGNALWAADSNVPLEIVQRAAEWQLTRPGDVGEIYNAAGQMQRIVDRAGFAQNLSYINGRLDAVTAPFGRTLRFAYFPAGDAKAGLLQQVTDPAGGIISYDYEADGAGRFNLAGVLYQAHDVGGVAKRYVRQYVYGKKPALPNALTALNEGRVLAASTDLAGVVLKNFAAWDYDANGRATLSTHAGNANRAELTFLSDGGTQIVDALGESRTWRHISHNGINRTRAIEGTRCGSCGGSLASTRTYSPSGYLDQVVDYNQNTSDYDFDTRGLLTSVTRGVGTADAQTVTTFWESAFRAPRCVFEPEHAMIYRYNGRRQVQSTTLYDTKSAGLAAPTEALCSEAVAQSGTFSALQKRTTTYAYFEAGPRLGLLQSVDGPLPVNPQTGQDDVTTYDYDVAAGNLITATNGLGQITRVRKYDAHGNPEVIEDSNGVFTQLRYDGMGRRASLQVGTGSYTDGAANVAFTQSELTQFEYNDSGSVSRVTYPNASFVTYGYDDANRLTDVVDHLGNSIHYTLNALGQPTLTETKDPQQVLKRKHGYDYDTQARLTASNGAPNGTVFFREYDGNNNLKVVDESTGLKTTFETYDSFNRARQVRRGIGPDSQLIKFDYDAQGNLSAVTDPLNLVTRYTYNGFGEVTQTESPDTGTFRVTLYDESGNAKTKVDARNVTTNYSYDALSRVVTADFGDQVITYAYDNDPANPASRFSNGRPRTVTDSTGTTRWTYDYQGRVDIKTQVTNGSTLSVNYDFDTNGQPDRIVYPSGTVIDYTVTNGRLSQINVGSQTLLRNVSYDPMGPVTGWTWGVGTGAVVRSYDLDGLLSRYTQGSMTKTHGYFGDGSLWYTFDEIPGQPVSQYPSEQYSYHAMGQISRSKYFSYGHDANNNQLWSGFKSWEWGIDRGTTFGMLYDDVPNVRKRLATSSWPINDDNLFGPGLQRTRTYAYDTAGNRTSDGHFTFTYDNRGRLVGSRVSTALAGVTYGINGLGQRVYKDVAKAGDANNDGVFDQSDIDTVVKAIASTGAILGNGDCNNDSVVNVQDLACINTKRGQSGFDRVLFVYDEAGHLIGEYRKNGASFTTLKEYVWLGDVPVAVLSGGQIYRIFADHLGTPRDIMNSADQVVWSWTNGVDPMGAMQPDEDPDRDNTRFVFNLRFPGQYYDIENGLHYNYFRTYDPTTGRYLEPDPIGLAGGMNLYAYVGGEPVNRTDSSGLVLDTIADIGFIFYDLYRIAADNIFGDCDNLGENVAALGADAAGAIVPFATGGGLAVRGGRNAVEALDPSTINYSQRTVGENASNYADDMAAGRWDWSRSGPITVMDRDGQWVTYDNRRLLAAQQARLSDVPVQVVKPNDLMPGTNISWEQGFQGRFSDQRNVWAGGVVPDQGVNDQPGIVKWLRPGR